MTYTPQQSAARRAARSMGKTIRRDASGQPDLNIYREPIGPIGPDGVSITRNTDAHPYRYGITFCGSETTSWIEPHGYRDGGPAAYVAHQGPGVYGRQAIAPTAMAAAVALIDITGGLPYSTPVAV